MSHEEDIGPLLDEWLEILVHNPERAFPWIWNPRELSVLYLSNRAIRRHGQIVTVRALDVHLHVLFSEIYELHISISEELYFRQMLPKTNRV